MSRTALTRVGMVMTAPSYPSPTNAPPHSMNVSNKAGRGGPGGNPRRHVPNDDWKASPPGDNPTKERQDLSDRDVDKM
jgi:hypothetical protein